MTQYNNPLNPNKITTILEIRDSLVSLTNFDLEEDINQNAEENNPKIVS